MLGIYCRISQEKEEGKDRSGQGGQSEPFAADESEHSKVSAQNRFICG